GTWYNSIKLSDKMMATILTEFSSLKRISFINTGTSSSGAASLGAHIGGLEILDLPGNNIDHKGIKALLTGVSKSLQYLGLAKNNLDTAAAQCLADSENLFNLRGLYISSNTIKDRGFSALVHGRFRYLEVLSVGSNELTDKLLLHENECLFSKSLRELSISENSMGPNALEQILECFPNLKKIDISENPVGDRGIQIIADSPAAGNIKSLKLSRCNLGPEGMEFLFKSSSFKKLQSLELVGNPLIDDGTALFMAKSKLIRKLSSLYIFNCGYGAKGEKALRRWKKN
ncbi:MAG TPA: hypothetical protein PK906_15395, partial [Spirochaetota bacterium]|nr:hypothetical protein [Spirochaetota bacterium]